MASRHSLDGRRRSRRGARNIHQSTACEPARVFYHLAHEKQQAPRRCGPQGRRQRAGAAAASPASPLRAETRHLRGLSARPRVPAEGRCSISSRHETPHGERRSADAPRPSPATDPVQNVRSPERKQQNQYQRIDAHDAPAGVVSPRHDNPKSDRHCDDAEKFRQRCKIPTDHRSARHPGKNPRNDFDPAAVCATAGVLAAGRYERAAGASADG
jgi:hypothetical protein